MRLRTPVCVSLWAVMCYAAAQAQPAVYDSFDGPVLHERWTVDSARDCGIAVDAERQVLMLEGMDNRYNHVETPMPEGADYVQVDICNISDVSASWSPSLIVYWDEGNWVRLMISLMYSLRLDTAAEGEHSVQSGGMKVMPGTWYRAAMRLADDHVQVMCAASGEEMREVASLPRIERWQGQPLVILGKGYMHLTGGNPDFDNNYYKSSKRTRMACDDFVIGDPVPVAPQIEASVAGREVAGEHDPATLQVAFWPNVTRPDTEGTLWLAPGMCQRLSLLYCNLDETHAAEDFRLEVEIPGALGLRHMTFGAHTVEVARTPGDGVTLYELRPSGRFGLPPAISGVDYETKEPPGWFSWPVSTMTPDLAMYCVPERSADGTEVRARAKAESGAGPWCEMKVRMVEPLPELIEGPPEHLGLSFWGGNIAHGSTDEAQVLDSVMATFARLGAKRVHTQGRKVVVDAVRAHGIEPFLQSWWHYSTQCPVSYMPKDEEKTSLANNSGSGFCPVVIAEGSGTYGKFLDDLTERMAGSECVGFMLDYECAMPLCYDERCRKAFVQHTGLNEVSWPEDVQKDGRYWRQWIGFRCRQGALYVKAIRDAARKAVPGCPMQAWVAGYDYNNTIETATIDVSKSAEFLTEPETPHYTLPADYSDMWTEEAGLGSVEMGIKTVQDTLDVVDKPVIFCSSIIYPLAGTPRWSDPQVLDAQIQTIIAQGARGVSFWGCLLYTSPSPRD